MTFTAILERIREQATRKGWSSDPTWLKLGAFKELGELIQAMEKWESLHRKFELGLDGVTLEQVISAHAEIDKEFGDAIYYLFQSAGQYISNLDDAFEMVYQDNDVKKKKTIDADGKLTFK